MWGVLGYCEADPNKGGTSYKYLVFEHTADEKGLKEAIKSLGNEFGDGVYFRDWKTETVCDSYPNGGRPFGEVYHSPESMTCEWGQVRSAVTKFHTKNKTPSRHETVVKARQDESIKKGHGTYLFLFPYSNCFKTII